MIEFSIDSDFDFKVFLTATEQFQFVRIFIENALKLSALHRAILTFLMYAR